jgi:hypothetical protein
MRRILLPLVALSLLSCTQQQAADEGAAGTNVAAVPDFYRNNTPWSTPRGKNFEPPPPDTPGAHGPIGEHPDHPNISNVERSSSGGVTTPRIGNDGNPLLKPWAAEQMAKTREAILAGGTPYDPAAHCWPPGVPAVASFGVAAFYFLQEREKVTIVYERGQIAREIYLNEELPENPKPQWHGYSVGRYDGDTLVVETSGLTDKTFIDVFNVPHTTALVVTERYRIGEDNRLHLLMTVDDPNTFNEPFTMYKTYDAGDQPLMEEVVCQEAGGDRFDETARQPPEDTTPDF